MSRRLGDMWEWWMTRPHIRKLKVWLARTIMDPVDFVWRAGRGKGYLPPWSMRAIAGRGQFEETGIWFVKEFQALCSLKPTDSVLDIGAGCGRIAIPLSRTLALAGRYVGVDIDMSLVRWCQKHIGKRNPNLSFLHIDLVNRQYNPSGSLDASTYRFPLGDASFHLIALLSVFTHMPRPQTENYLTEASRLLAPGGHCFATFFLLNQEQDELQKKGLNRIHFEFGDNVCRYASKHLLERTVGYHEEYIKELAKSSGLEISCVKYGNWAGRQSPWHLQDIVVFQKPLKEDYREIIYQRRGMW